MSVGSLLAWFTVKETRPGYLRVETHAASEREYGISSTGSLGELLKW